MPEQDGPNDAGIPGNDGESVSRHQSLSELKSAVWQEALDLFEGDEAEASDWMIRNRPFLGSVAPADMLDSHENIERLRCFIQQVQRGIVP
jgi:uncharacterized protein (DUF2384 family)